MSDKLLSNWIFSIYLKFLFRVPAFEKIAEGDEGGNSASRPTSLGMLTNEPMMAYREPNSGTIRETRGSDSS